MQARSEATVGVLHDAGLQVLLTLGYRGTTTTRVAERAGVSVGTLYQYFPNRRALMRAVVERYLARIVGAVAADCRALRGRPLGEMAVGLADAFVAAKLERVEVARAMREPLADVDGAPLVRAAAAAGARGVGELLRSCPRVSFEDADAVASFAVAASMSLLQAAIDDHVREVDAGRLRVHLRALLAGYLGQMSREVSDADDRPAGVGVGVV